MKRKQPSLRVAHATVIALLAGAVLAAVPGFACSGDGDSEPVIDPGDGGSYAPQIDPAAFTSTITNRFLPLAAGQRWTYESDDGAERVVVEVLNETRIVMGVETRVVRERAFEDDEVVEDTLDWYAEDDAGNVWYFGEDSKEIEDGKVVSTEGSWEAGINDAQPGIVMLAQPQVGDAYRQEFLDGEAEDMAEVLDLAGSRVTPAGSYDHLLVTREWTPLEPDVVEEKYYADGIGLVAERTVKGGSDAVALVVKESFDGN